MLQWCYFVWILFLLFPRNGISLTSLNHSSPFKKATIANSRKSLLQREQIWLHFIFSNQWIQDWSEYQNPENSVLCSKNDNAFHINNRALIPIQLFYVIQARHLSSSVSYPWKLDIYLHMPITHHNAKGTYISTKCPYLCEDRYMTHKGR